MAPIVRDVQPGPGGVRRRQRLGPRAGARHLRARGRIELAYVGNHTAHALLQPDQNACPNFASATGVSCDSLRPIPYIYGLNGTASFGFGNYAGMTASLTKRYSAGLQFIAAYTYGHALANSGTTLSGSNGLGTIDPTNYGTSYTSASWDVRHNFTTGLTYDVPFGRGKKFGSSMNRAADILVGGWQMNGVITLHTGNPFTLRASGCQGQWNICRPDLVSGKNPNNAPSGGRTPTQWFDTSAVTGPAALTGGNLGMQSNNAPGAKTLDFSLFKDFALTERWKVQFRAESFNLTNTPQFTTPDNNLSDGTNFGRITGTQPGSERHIQFALRLQF